jgi:hypothetical protein
MRFVSRLGRWNQARQCAFICVDVCPATRAPVGGENRRGDQRQLRCRIVRGNPQIILGHVWASMPVPKSFPLPQDH